MNRKTIEREGKKWIEKGIISNDQLKQIANQYPERQHRSLLYVFAGLFIGLGFLTFIASNWSEIPPAGKMAIILVPMLAFYISGDWLYQNRSKWLGTSFYLIGILIFGSGIFLVGQIYHYTVYSSFPFVIWTLGAFLLYLVRKENVILVLSFIILTVGQVYSAVNYSSFGWFLYGLFMIGFGYFTYQKGTRVFAALFGISFVIQSLVLLVIEHFDYIWLSMFLLAFYILSDWLPKPILVRTFRIITLVSAFVLNVFNVFLFEHDNILSGFGEGLWFFGVFIFLLALGIFSKWKNRDFDHLADFILFMPVFYVKGAASFLSLILLYGFSISWLVAGYRDDDYERVNIGTVTFLVSTAAAYVQLAWDYMDRSLFFFIGGLFLFALSYVLEKRRRNVSHNQRGDRK